jgi:hypothetical protein
MLVIGFMSFLPVSVCRAVRQTLAAFVLNKEGNPMANLVVKLKKGDSVKDLCDKVKEHFSQKGDDSKGELTAKIDGSVKIAYNVKGRQCDFHDNPMPQTYR